MRYVWTVALCAVLAGCQAKQSASLHVESKLESLVPADTIFVAGARMDAVRNTSIYQKLLHAIPVPQLDEFARRTGLDPQKDLTELLICSTGKQNLVLARGQFRVAELEARLAANGMPRVEYQGHRIFGDERGSVVFIDPTTAAAGPGSELRSLIAREKGLGAMPSALAEQLRTVPAKDQIYAALHGDLQSLNLRVPETSQLANVLQVLKSMDSAALGIDLTSGFDAVAHVHCKSERDAKFVHDMVKGIVGFGRLNAPENRPELLKIYDGIEVTQDQAETTVQARVPQDLADKFIDLWTKR